MDLVCFVEGCHRQPISYCSCTSKFVLCCTKHIRKHYDENENLEHPTLPLFKKVDISKRKEERTRFEEILTIISQSKSLILKSIADMHKQIDHCTHEI